MGLTSFIGRLLLAIIFIGAGVNKFLAPKDTVDLFNARYPVVHEYVQKVAKPYFDLPPQVSPKFVKSVSNEVVYGVAGAEALLGFFLLLDLGFAGTLLSLLMLSFIGFIHNPYLFGKTEKEFNFERLHALYDLGIAGALLLVGTRVRSQPTQPAAGTKTQPTGAKTNTQGSGAGNKQKGKKRD